jgi:hypothetical protein
LFEGMSEKKPEQQNEAVRNGTVETKTTGGNMR